MERGLRFIYKTFFHDYIASFLVDNFHIRGQIIISSYLNSSAICGSCNLIGIRSFFSDVITWIIKRCNYINFIQNNFLNHTEERGIGST